MGDGGDAGVLLLLAVADREFFQAPEEPRPAVGAMATGDRAGDRPTAPGGRDGLCGGLAPASGRFARGDGTEGHSDPPERPPDQAQAPPHGTGSSGRVVGLALDAGAA